MADHRMLQVTEIALSMLSQWLATWEQFKGHRSGEIRRIALKGKCRGLVCHDRLLMRCTEVING